MDNLEQSTRLSEDDERSEALVVVASRKVVLDLADGPRQRRHRRCDAVGRGLASRERLQFASSEGEQGLQLGRGGRRQRSVVLRGQFEFRVGDEELARSDEDDSPEDA
jgi:hypothetical protein